MKRPKRELVKGDYEFCVALEAYADWQAKVKKEQAYAIVRQDNQISELKSFRKYTVDLEQQIAELKEALDKQYDEGYKEGFRNGQKE